MTKKKAKKVGAKKKKVSTRKAGLRDLDFGKGDGVRGGGQMGIGMSAILKKPQ